MQTNKIKSHHYYLEYLYKIRIKSPHKQERDKIMRTPDILMFIFYPFGYKFAENGIKFLIYQFKSSKQLNGKMYTEDRQNNVNTFIIQFYFIGFVSTFQTLRVFQLYNIIKLNTSFSFFLDLSRYICSYQLTDRALYHFINLGVISIVHIILSICTIIYFKNY